MHAHKCALRVRSAPTTRNFTEVSSPWMTRDRNNRWCISWYKASSKSAAPASQSSGQAVQRRLIGEFGRDDVRQQPRATQAASDRADFRRPGGLEALLHRHRLRLAVLAGVALLNGAQDQEVGRLQVQLLRRL